MSAHESTQQMMVHGKCEDIYYPSPEMTKKECLRTKANTKYVQAFTQLAGGVSVFTIPPNFGLQDVICSFVLPTKATGGYAGLGLAAGWGYALIKQVSYRVSGSSQYYITGQQLLQHALKRVADGTARDDLLALGGSTISGDALSGAKGYVWLDLPWSRPTVEGKPCPLPTDVLSSQIVITVELYPLSAIMSAQAGAVAVPDALAAAEFQVQQITLENRADSMAAKVDMATHVLNYPCEFVQQEVTVNLSGVAGAQQQVTATGFKSGSLKSIEMWLTRTGDTSGATKNPLKFYIPTDIVLTYAGDQYARYDFGTSALWNLINGKFAPRVNTTVQTFAAGNYGSAASQSPWVTLQLAQPFDSPETSSYMLTEGLQVTNGIVNLTFTLPAIAGDTTADWVLHLSYVYATTLVFSQNTCEFAF